MIWILICLIVCGRSYLHFIQMIKQGNNNSMIQLGENRFFVADDHSICIYDWVDGKFERQRNNTVDSSHLVLKVSTDGKWLAASNPNSTVSIYKVNGITITYHTLLIYSHYFAFADHTSTIATSDIDGTIAYIYSAEDGFSSPVTIFRPYPIRDLEWHGTKQLGICGFEGCQVYQYQQDPKDWIIKQQFQFLEGNNAKIYLRFSGTKPMVVSSRQNQSIIRFFELGNSEAVQLYSVPESITFSSMSKNEDIAIVGGGKSTWIYQWDNLSWKQKIGPIFQSQLDIQAGNMNQNGSELIICSKNIIYFFKEGQNLTSLQEPSPISTNFTISLKKNQTFQPGEGLQAHGNKLFRNNGSELSIFEIIITKDHEKVQILPFGEISFNSSIIDFDVNHETYELLVATQRLLFFFEHENGNFLLKQVLEEASTKVSLASSMAIVGREFHINVYQKQNGIWDLMQKVEGLGQGLGFPSSLEFSQDEKEFAVGYLGFSVETFELYNSSFRLKSKIPSSVCSRRTVAFSKGREKLILFEYRTGILSIFDWNELPLKVEKVGFNCSDFFMKTNSEVLMLACDQSIWVHTFEQNSWIQLPFNSTIQSASLSELKERSYIVFTDKNGLNFFNLGNKSFNESDAIQPNNNYSQEAFTLKLFILKAYLISLFVLVTFLTIFFCICLYSYAFKGRKNRIHNQAVQQQSTTHKIST